MMESNNNYTGVRELYDHGDTTNDINKLKTIITNNINGFQNDITSDMDIRQDIDKQNSEH